MDDVNDFIDKALGVKKPVSPYDPFIEDSALRHDVDPDFIRGVIGQESSWKPKALSPKGASGLMQLMPATARRMGVTDIYDPKQNIEGGTKYLKFLLDRYKGDIPKTLAGYNAGEGAVDKYQGVPPYRETRDYVQKIGSKYKGSGYHPQTANKFIDSILSPANNVDSFIDQTLNAPSAQPIPESPNTIQAQMTSALDPLSPRAAVLTTSQEQNGIFGNVSGFIPVSYSRDGYNGTLWVNKAKARKLKLRTPQDIEQFITNNPDAMTRLIGKVDNVGGETSGGMAVKTTAPNGTEVSSSVVLTPETAEEQINIDQQAFPGSTSQIVPTDDVVAERLRILETLGKPAIERPEMMPYETVQQPIQKRTVKQPTTAVRRPLGQAQKSEPFDEDQFNTANLYLTGQGEQPLTKEQYQAALRSSGVGEVTVDGQVQDVVTESPTQSKRYADEKFEIPLTAAANNDFVNAETASRISAKYGVNYEIAKQLLDAESPTYVDNSGKKLSGTLSINDSIKQQAKSQGYQNRIIGGGLIRRIVEADKGYKDREAVYQQKLQEYKGKQSDAESPLAAEINAAIDSGMISAEKGRALLAEENAAYQEWRSTQAVPDRNIAGALRTQYNDTAADEFLQGRRHQLDRLKAEAITDYGSFAKLKKEKDRIEKEYGTVFNSTRPLARPTEAALNIGRYFAKLPASLTQSALTLMELNPVLMAKDLFTGTDTKASDNSIYQAMQDYKNRIDSSKNNDFRNEMIVNDVPTALAQFGAQAVLAALTGGASVALPIAEASLDQYQTADKAGSDKKTRLAAMSIGAIAAVPDALLKAKWLEALTPAEKTGFVTNLSKNLFEKSRGVVGDAEAKVVSKSMVETFVKNAGGGYIFEKNQERLEDIINKSFGKATYAPQITWDSILHPSQAEERGYEAAGILGIFGGSVETVTKNMPLSELQKTPTALDELLKEKRITPEEKTQIQQVVGKEIKRRETVILEPLVKPAGGADKDRGKTVIPANPKTEVEDEIQESPSPVDTAEILPTEQVAEPEKEISLPKRAKETAVTETSEQKPAPVKSETTPEQKAEPATERDVSDVAKHPIRERAAKDFDALVPEKRKESSAEVSSPSYAKSRENIDTEMKDIFRERRNKGEKLPLELNAKNDRQFEKKLDRYINGMSNSFIRDWHDTITSNAPRTTTAEAKSDQKATAKAAGVIAVPRSAVKRYAYADEVADQIADPEFRKAERRSRTEKPSARTGFTKTQTEYLSKALQNYAQGYPEDSQYGAKGSPATRETFAVPDDGVLRLENLQQANRLHQKITGKPLREGLPKERATIPNTASVSTSIPGQAKGSNIARATMIKNFQQDNYGEIADLDIPISEVDQNYIGGKTLEANDGIQKGWQEVEIDGQKGYTDNHIMLVTDTPFGKRRLSSKKPNVQPVIDRVLGDKPNIINPVKAGARTYGVVIKFENGAEVQFQYYNLVKANYPNATFKGTDDPNNTLLIYNGKEIIGAVQPLEVQTANAPLKSEKANELPTDTNIAEKPSAESERTGDDGNVALKSVPSERANRSPLGFYSQVEQTILDKMPSRASAEQIKGILSPANGIKKEELAWIDIDSFLAENPKVSKDELLAFVRANNATVEEVVKGDGKSGGVVRWEDNDLMEEGERQATLIDNGDGTWSFESDFSEGSEIFNSREEAMREAEATTIGNVYSEPVQTKFSQYTLPGADEGSYRELLLTMPERDFALGDPELKQNARGKWAWFYGDIQDTGAFDTREQAEAARSQIRSPKAHDKVNYQSSHWSEPNVLAHVRFDTRDGGKTLHIAEIQSDWASQGRKNGFKLNTPVTKDIARDLGYDVYKTKSNLGVDAYFVERPDTDRSISHAGFDTESEAWKSLLNYLQTKADNRVPNMPFKSTSGWVGLAFRRMLRYAVENGYDRVTFDTGETNAERYDLSKQVEKITSKLGADGLRTVDIQVKNDPNSIRFEVDSQGTVQDSNQGNLNGKPLVDVVGKEVADKILNDSGLPVGGSYNWIEATKPDSVRELGKNVLGGKMYALMPLNHVDAGMLPALQNNKVREAVVSFLPVDVVDIVRRSNFTPDQLFGNGDVVFDGLPVDARNTVSVGVLDAIRKAGTAIRTKLEGLGSAGGDKLLLPALRTSDLDARDIVGIVSPRTLFDRGADAAVEKETTTAGAATKSLAGEMGSPLVKELSATELAKLLNAHNAIVAQNKGLLKQIFRPPNTFKLEGENLKIGASGMVAFYDKILPAEFNKYLKRFGAKVESAKLITEYHPRRKASSKITRVPVHSLEITPAMRDAVMQGQPLFQVADAAKLKQLAKSQNLTELTPEMKTSVKGEVVNLDTPEAHEIARTLLSSVERKSRDKAPILNGVFIEPDKAQDLAEASRGLADLFEARGHDATPLNEFAGNIETALKEGKGVVINDIRHERTHQASYLGATDKKFADRYANLEEIAQDPDFQQFYKKLNKIQGKSSVGVAAEEALAYLGDGDYKRFGLTREQSVSILAKLVKAYAEKNGIDALKHFDNTDLYETVETYRKSQSRETSDDGGRAVSKEREAGRESAKAPPDETGNDPRTFTPQGREKLSQSPKTMRGNVRDFNQVEDRSYTSTTNAEREEFANDILDKGVDDARKWLEQQLEDGNNNAGATQAVGLSLMNHYAKNGGIEAMNDIAKKIIQKGTDNAQAVQAMSLVSQFDPEQAASYASLLKQRRTGKDLTPQERERATDIAETLDETAKVAALGDAAAQDAQDYINELKAENEAMAENAKQSKIDVANLKRQLTRWKNKALGLSNTAGRITRTHRDLLKNKEDVLTRLREKFPNAVLKMVAGKPDSTLKSIPSESFDDKTRQDLIDYTALQILEGQSYKDTIANLKDITSDTLNDDEVKAIHANAVNAIRGESPTANMTAEKVREVREKIKTRNEHKRMAREFQGANKNPNLTSLERELLDIAPDDRTRLASLILARTPDLHTWFDTIEATYPGLPKKEKKELYVKATDLKREAQTNLRKRSIENRRNITLAEGDLERIREERRVNMVNARRTQKEAENFYNGLVRSKGDVTAETVVNWRRASLLTGVKTHLRNMFGNVGFAATEEAARGLSWLADVSAGRFTGERSVGMYNAKSRGNALMNLIKTDETLRNAVSPDAPLGRERGITAAKKILMHGDSLENLERQQHSESILSEKFTGAVSGKIAKGLDHYINGVFRVLGAEDALFKVIAFRRSLEEQAQLLSKGDKDKQKELILNPTETMQRVADDYATFMTFQNDNWLSSQFTAFKKKYPAIKTIAETIVPYDRTPTNIILRITEHLPIIGQARAIKQAYNINKEPVKEFRNRYRHPVEADLSKESEWANMSAQAKRKAIDDGIATVWTREQQAKFARTFGRSTMGTALFGLGFALFAKGLLTGTMEPDDDDKKETGEFFDRIKKGIENRSLLIPGIGRFVLPDDPASRVISMGATFGEQMQMAKGNDAAKAWQSAKESTAELISDQPLLQGTGDLYHKLYKKGKFGEVVGGILGGYVPTIISDIGEISDDEARTTSGYKQGEPDGLDRQTRGFRNSLLRRMPVARKYADASTRTVPKDVRGGVLRRAARAIDPTNMRPPQEYNAPTR